MILKFLLILTLFALGFCSPTKNLPNNHTFESILALGYPVTWNSFVASTQNESSWVEVCSGQISDKNGNIDNKYRWYGPTFYEKYLVFFHIDKIYNAVERSKILEGMHTIQEQTCIQFWGFDDPAVLEMAGLDWVHIYSGSGCFAYVGRLGIGKQELSLSVRNCVRKDIIVHELLHMVGLEHEHQRPDRDNYIQVNWNNITPGMEHNFKKLSSEDYSSFGSPYDIKSIMHYFEYSHSSNGSPTLVSKNGEHIGVNQVMSQWDIFRVQKMYNC